MGVAADIKRTYREYTEYIELPIATFICVKVGGRVKTHEFKLISSLDSSVHVTRTTSRSFEEQQALL